MTPNLSQHGITVKNGFGFFWGGVLSNWYKCNFIAESVKYTSTEQHMMYNKAVLFNDLHIAGKILKTSNTKEIKALGRKVRNFDQKVWDQMHTFIVLEGNYEKFIQNENLADILVATEGLELVEASPYDKIWGVGLAVDHPDIIHKDKWRGTNLLGKVLTDVRAEIITTRSFNGLTR
jgi:ribA/ribD-fused uncharacterized protein